MKRKIIPVLIGCTLSFSALAAQPTAERYVVSFPEGTHVNYAGAFASAFPNGLPVGIGSGLLFTGKQGDALTFATITDRGPNADSPKEGKTKLNFRYARFRAAADDDSCTKRQSGGHRSPSSA